METKPILSIEQPTRISALEIAIAAQSVSAKPATNESATSKSAWRKFSAENSIPALKVESANTTSSTFTSSWSTWTSSWGSSNDPEILKFMQEIGRAFEEGRFEDVLKGLNVFESRLFPAISAHYKAFNHVLKSKCYEEMGQYDIALKETEKAIQLIAQHRATVEEFEFPSADSYLAIRKAGLLLALDKEGEAIALLKEYQPGSVEAALLYRVIEKKLGITLLQPKTVLENANLEELFLAGKYEEVIAKAPVWCNEEIRAAALAMLGRTEEAVKLLDLSSNTCSTCFSSVKYALIQALHGDRSFLNCDWRAEDEFFSQCPIQLFAQWLCQKEGQ